MENAMINMLEWLAIAVLFVGGTVFMIGALFILFIVCDDRYHRRKRIP